MSRGGIKQAMGRSNMQTSSAQRPVLNPIAEVSIATQPKTLKTGFQRLHEEELYDISAKDSVNSKGKQEQVIQGALNPRKGFGQFCQKGMNKGEGLPSFDKQSGENTSYQTSSSSPSFPAEKSRPVVNSGQNENSPTSEKPGSKKASGFSNFKQVENSSISKKPESNKAGGFTNFEQVGTGSNAVKLGQGKHSKGKYQDNEVDDEDKHRVENARNGGFREFIKEDKEDRPRGYVPKNRTVDEIYEEDKRYKDLYAHAFDADEEVKITGLDTQPSYIENWTDIPLHKTVLENIDACNYIRPRKIQAYVIPLVLEGFDFKAQAETGSGKSGSFLIPIISKIAEENEKVPRMKKESYCPRAIIVAPTRELVMQLFEQSMKIARDTEVKVKFCYGEYEFCQNSYEILKGTDILVATPGRLIHFMTSSIVGISRLKYLVFDEADKLFDESFTEDFDKMVKIPGFPSKNEIQVMLFSATFPESSVNWLESLLKSKHVVVKNLRANEPNARIKQSFEECSANDKTIRLLNFCQHLISEYQKEKGSDNVFPQILAFVRKCDTADAYSFYMNQNGIKTLSLNSKRGQKSREKSLSMFREKNITMIIATDVCSRGLDIKDLDYVINVDMPGEFSTYVQRIGRTGRLKGGFSHSFVDMMHDQMIIPDLVSSLKAEGQDVPKFMTEDQKPVPSFNLKPIERTYTGFD